MHLNFIHNLSVLTVSAAVAAGTTLVTTDVVDTRGFDSVAFIAVTGDVTDTSVLTLTGQAGDAADGSDAANLAATATFTADATSGDEKALVLDLHKPRQRYVRATLTRGTANAEVAAIIAVLYNSHEAPVGLSADTLAATLANDPAPA